MKSDDAGTVSPRRRAASTMALASGCSESDSAAAAIASTSSSVRPPVAATAVTVGSPLVSVPVLSNSTAPTVRMLSSASRSLISTPPRAARSVAMDTTSGIARPRACGQAITSTVMVRITASSGCPMKPHTTAVTMAAPSANQNSQAAALSASRCARDEEFCASVTSRWMPASAVSSPTAVTLTRSPESVATVPATTRVAHAAAHGPGFAGHHRLVHLGGTVDDDSVGGHAAAGPHDHDVVDPQFGGCHRLDAVAAVSYDAFRLVGQQRRQRVQRRRGLRQRPHLDPVAQQHDHDQQRELPPEVEVVRQHAEAGAPRRDERDRDGQADQQHHSRCAGTDFTDRSGEERPAAPEVHHGAQHR